MACCSSGTPNTYRVSGFQRIKLYHDYSPRVLLAADVIDVTATALNVLVKAAYDLGPTTWTWEGLLDQAQVVDESHRFSSGQLWAALRQGLKQGVFTTVVPPVIVWTAPTPVQQYTVAAILDSRGVNRPYVLELLQQTKGPATPAGTRWFMPYCAPKWQSFSAFPDQCPCSTSS